MVHYSVCVCWSLHQCVDQFVFHVCQSNGFQLLTYIEFLLQSSLSYNSSIQPGLVMMGGLPFKLRQWFKSRSPSAKVCARSYHVYLSYMLYKLLVLLYYHHVIGCTFVLLNCNCYMVSLNIQCDCPYHCNVSLLPLSLSIRLNKADHTVFSSVWIIIFIIPVP